jgi:hypothetical protein
MSENTLILTEPFCLIEAEDGSGVVGIDVGDEQVPVEALPSWPRALRRMRFDGEALSFDQWALAREWVALILTIEAKAHIGEGRKGLN